MTGGSRSGGGAGASLPGRSGSLTAVLDVGKTLSKLTLWTAEGELVARETRRNARVDVSDYLTLDVDGIEEWAAATLAAFSKLGSIAAIVPVAHGAAAAVVRGGELVAPPLDYEEAIPDDERADYDARRPGFAESGSPRLPDGLNLGAQLDRLERLRPCLLAGDAMILLWPQYWAWRLSGVAASEVTSLGCHTDLWNPFEARPSSLAVARGWAERLPPLVPAAAALSPLLPGWRERTGLPADAMVHCGLHDSNAALLAARGFEELRGREVTVLSTGTWFVAMRSMGSLASAPALREARDCLVNVDADGRPVPSARFMGGREVELLTGLDTRRIDITPDQPSLVEAASDVLASGSRVLPTLTPGFGPFPDQRGRWIDIPVDEAGRRAAVSLYAALVANVSLDLIGACERILVEGRFAEAEVFVRALAALRPDAEVYRAHAHNDVSFGALRLLNPELRPAGSLERVAALPGSVQRYRDAWARDVSRAKVMA